MPLFGTTRKPSKPQWWASVKSNVGRKPEFWEADRTPNEDVAPLSAAPGQVRPFVKLSNEHLGRILDGGKASIYAVHLLAIKASGGPDWVLNETHVAKVHGLGRRAFRSGLQLLKSRGVLTRRQKYARRYADEQLVPATSSAFTRLPRELLVAESAVVAFAAAANLRPDPASPAEVARRIGIRCNEAVARIVARAKELDTIEFAVGPRGKQMVARKGVSIQFAENVPGEIVPGENVPAQIRCKEVKEDGRRSRKKNTVSVRSACAERPTGSFSEYENRDDQSPAWIILPDWKSAKFFRDDEGAECLLGNGRREPNMTLEGWVYWLEQFGGAPAHVKTGHAFRQAIEIADHAVEYHHADFYGEPIEMQDALAGIAFRIAEAHRLGKPIRSLALVADPIIRGLRFGNHEDEWAYDWPSFSLSAKDFETVRAWAKHGIEIARQHGIRLHERAMLGTRNIDTLGGLIRQYGPKAVMAGIAGTDPLPPNEQVIGWAYFEDATSARDVHGNLRKPVRSRGGRHA